LYKGKTIDIVKDYVYLGVPFSSSGVFHKAANYFVNRANIAINSVWSILGKAKCRSWDARVKLFESLTLSTLLYASSIWGLRYESVIEKVQTNFFKRVLSIPKCTPNYMVRLETGRCNIICTVYKQAISYWLKLIEMENSRVPKLLFLRLKYIDENCEINDIIGSHNLKQKS